MISEKVGYAGTFTVIDKNGETVIHNRIMDTVLDQLSKVLQGDTPDLEIEYLAIGTGSTAVTDADTTLDTEIFRTAYTTRTVGATGVINHLFVIQDSEAIAQWKEIGIFGGSTATSSADTGTLISRVLFSKDKLAGEEIQIQRSDSIRRV